MSTRATQERLINRFGQSEIRASIIELLRADGLSILSDDAVEALARDLATQDRLRQRLNQQNRAEMAQPHHNTSEAA